MRCVQGYVRPKRRRRTRRATACVRNPAATPPHAGKLVSCATRNQRGHAHVTQHGIFYHTRYVGALSMCEHNPNLCRHLPLDWKAQVVREAVSRDVQAHVTKRGGHYPMCNAHSRKDMYPSRNPVSTITCCCPFFPPRDVRTRATARPVRGPQTVRKNGATTAHRSWLPGAERGAEAHKHAILGLP